MGTVEWRNLVEISVPQSMKIIYYINTNETPGELSGEIMISYHVKITCSFMLLWLHNKSRLSQQRL